MLCAGLVAFIRFEMILDKDGCSAVDLFLVFLQISGENPKILVCRSKRFQMIWDDFRQKWLLGCRSAPCPPNFSNRKSEKNEWSAAPHLRWSPRAALTWQMSLSLAPIISRGQELKDFSRSLSEHDFQVSSPSQLEDHWIPLWNVTFLSCSLECSIYQ